MISDCEAQSLALMIIIKMLVNQRMEFPNVCCSLLATQQ